MLSIVIPVHNRKHDFAQALQSLTLQTKNRFIVVVVDDNSTEDVKSVAQEYTNKLNLVYLKHDENKGPAAARNTGLKWSIDHNMELIMFVDSDDLLCPNAVERLTYEINHKNANMIYSSIIVHKNNDPNPSIDPMAGITWTHGKIYRVSFLVANDLYFDESLHTNEDMAFNLQAFYIAQKQKSGGAINETLYLWRQNDNSLTHTPDIRKKCASVDYINAMYTVTQYAIAHDCLDTHIIRQIILIYNYYQNGKVLNVDLSDEIEQRIKFMLNLPIVTKALSKPKKLPELLQGLHVAYIDDNLVYKYHQTFFDWYDAYKEEQ